MSRLSLGSIMTVEEENKAWGFLCGGDGNLLMVGKMRDFPRCENQFLDLEFDLKRKAQVSLSKS